jgi:dipeptidase D
VIDAFAGLEPAGFWAHFAALTRIPRPSHEEEQAVAHVTDWAQARGFATRRDAAGNLAVDVPASPGREAAPAVVLQGHLDMVCEREPGSPYDPRAGRIHVVRDGEWLRAEGTTLGADDGVAIAAMLAVAEDADAPHGRLELLMTVAEEVGLGGAQALDPALVTGDVLLNLDSEEDGTLTIGCAGSEDHVLRFDAAREPLPADADVLRVTVGGGRGGHSGGDIAAGRANAIKLLGHALHGAGEVRIATFDGGASRNAIPRDAVALVAGDGVGAAVEAADAAARRIYARTDPGVRIAAEPGGTDPAGGDGTLDPAAGAWTPAASARLLDLVALLPAGPLAMSPDFAGLVETSSSVGVAGTAGGTLTLRCLSRSQDDDALPVVRAQIEAAARLAGATHESLGSYPAWRPDPDAPLLATATRVHVGLFGAEPEVSATHGGLETALIGAKRPGLPMLSFGPEIQGPHAPGERLHIASAGRFMQLLRALLDELSR